MDNSKLKDVLISILAISLGVITITASVIYLISGNMIPGLIPLGTAALMIPMIMIWRKRQDGGKIYAILFMIAGILNLIAAILQILDM